ncbi:Hpt domain-containing protein [Sulfitobacter sp. JB4-11]|uniref:Hpt domain-containing protein n=1 Tax=Sulfitobacter rhodophyticola TaxID=3238304 RepID=UPI003513F475
MINWQRVSELREEVGPEDFDEVVALFLEEVEDTLQRIVTNPDPGTLAEDMHFLKGCALNMGFRTFTAACQHAERRTAEGAADDVDPKQIEETYLTSKQAFLSALPGTLTGDQTSL